MPIATELVMALGGVCAGLLAGVPIGVYRERADQRRAARRAALAVRRPIEPRTDGQRVTRDPSQPARHARVSTAHISQQRRAWK